MVQTRLSAEARPIRALYASYFGLTEAPFSIAPDPRYLFMSERHREALAHLLYGSGEGGGFVQLTGEVGTGKTTLCRALLEQLPPEVDVALILNPRLTAFELLATVCDELRIPYRRDTISLKELVDELDRHLLDAHAAGRRTVLIIDEAQDLAPDVLEQVRLLTNLETEREKLLQIILIGQPELLALLDRPELRQLGQRVTARYHLGPFSARETGEYIRHRLKVAGRDEAATAGPLFTRGAIQQVHRAAGGVPRLINVICDRALLGAYAHDRTRIDTATVRRAAREVLGRGRRPASARPASWLAGAALAAALAAVWLVASPGRLGPLLPRLVPERARPTAAPASPRGPVAPPAIAARPTASRLADLLATPGLRSDRPAALARLYARWRPDTRAGAPAGACEQERLGELRCLTRAGTWTRLRPFDVPAVIELVTPAGDRHHATVIRLTEDTATLDLDDRPRPFALAEIDRYWTGAFVLLWKPPALESFLIRPGTRGKDILWLRGRLAALDGSSVPGPDARLYDEALKQRVIAFQRSRQLTDDGIAGEETLALVALAAREPGTPSLSGSRP
ncbi:MAG TPA: AAA family ATPase [Methylomirabilota bacterium]|jgi:general secretion pathway protein A|nr:AAA family ATPase [Methylomirabilota bacterium]